MTSVLKMPPSGSILKTSGTVFATRHSQLPNNVYVIVYIAHIKKYINMFENKTAFLVSKFVHLCSLLGTQAFCKTKENSSAKQTDVNKYSRLYFGVLGVLIEIYRFVTRCSRR